MSLLMKILRWIIFFPVICVVISIVQTLAVLAGEAGPWWLWVPFYLLFGNLLSLGAVGYTTLICPKPKFGCFVVLGLFVVLELFAWFSFNFESALVVILRLNIDMVIIGVLLGQAVTNGAALQGSKKES